LELELGYSLDVNALNFCRFSLLPLHSDDGDAQAQALVAVPNLVESALASAVHFAFFRDVVFKTRALFLGRYLGAPVYGEDPCRYR
jgi:hypothetical protein